MKPRWMIPICLIIMSMSLLACSLASSVTPPPGGGPSIGATASPTATLPPIAPGTQAVPTRRPPTVISTIQAGATPTPSATSAAPAATRPPVSTGPLDFTISIAGCRLDPARDGGVILTLRFDARGGNGVYTYYHENQKVPRTFERPATKGTAVIDSFRVDSGDGQSVKRKERFIGAEFGCP